MKKIIGGINASKGFLSCGLHSGLKRSKKDIALIYSLKPCEVAATFTTNVVKAAPVLYDKGIVEANNKVRAIIINSGNANACTGKQGDEDCLEEAAFLAEKLNIKPNEALVASTGVIGVPLNMDIIKKGITMCVDALSDSIESANDAAKAICTTDTYEKEIAYSFMLGGKECHIGGMAKGAGMIHPNMATTLCFVTTDANVSKSALQKALGESINDTFNMISVDGDTSTNDSCILLSNGEAGNRCLSEDDDEYEIFFNALNSVLEHLAKELVRDGEGATRFMEVVVKGAKDDQNARLMARSVVSSSLFKAALFGSDANWGRVLCAMGYSKAEFDPLGVKLKFKSQKGEILVLSDGLPLPFSEEKAKEILLEEEILVEATLSDGSGKATAWGCDLTYDYVKINGDYRS